MSTPRLSPHIQIISPHQDDAAFSLALTIAHFSDAGAGISIINCFTVSEYAPRAPQLSPAEVVQLRHNEDRQFTQMLAGTSLIDLHFSDAPLRLGLAVESLCLSREDSAAKRFDPDAPKLKQSFLRLPPVDFTLIPLALGGHIDHLAARDQALSAFKSKPIGLYEDLPYASRFENVDSEVSAILAALDLACEPLTQYYDNAVERKFQYISAYSSQANPEELRSIASYSGKERLWLTAEGRWWPQV